MSSTKTTSGDRTCPYRHVIDRLVRRDKTGIRDLWRQGVDDARCEVGEDGEFVCPALCHRHQSVCVHVRDVESVATVGLDLAIELRYA